MGNVWGNRYWFKNKRVEAMDSRTSGRTTTVLKEFRNLVKPTHKRRTLESVLGQVIHYNDLMAKYNWSFERCIEFYDKLEATGNKWPYHIWIFKNGDAIQLLPLTVVGPAAENFNAHYTQIVLEGDFNKHPPTPDQAVTLVALCTALAMGGQTEIIGHTEKPGGSSDPRKVCPGKHLNLDGLRTEVNQKLTSLQKEHILKSGVVT